MMRHRETRTSSLTMLRSAFTAAFETASDRLSRVRGRVLIAAAAAIALIAIPFLPAQGAQAVTHTFLLNSFDVTAAAKDATPGDGICATAAQKCTMRAAIEESNALNLPKGAVLITVLEGTTGNIDVLAANNQPMRTTTVSNQDGSAHFEITAPVTIDLLNKVTVETAGDTGGAVFHANGADISFRNMTQVIGGESSFVMGPKANGVTINGGSTFTRLSYGAERFLTIREGAQNITVQNYSVHGFYHSGNATGLFYFNAQSATPIKNVVIDNVRVANSTSGGCGGSDGTGCRTNLMQFNPHTPNVVLDGFSFTNSHVSNLGAHLGMQMGSTGGTLTTTITGSNITIRDNEFINVQGAGTSWTDGFLSLPSGQLGGENAVEGNAFVRAAAGQAYALTRYGAGTGGSTGKLRIADNYFDGYAGPTIFLYSTGDVNVEKNTFGARNASQARPGLGEETGENVPLMVDNYSVSNNKANTWYPSKPATVLTEAAPDGAVQVESPLPAETPACVAVTEVTAPVAAPLPASVVELDVYWTANKTAEVYLGRASNVSGATAKLLVDLPIGPQEFPSSTVGGTTRATIVDPETGKGSGYLRLQTVATSTGQSSQYSRMVEFSGNCSPALTIEQGNGQNDPTLARDLHYTVKSSMPLDPATVTAEVVDVNAVAVPGTLSEDKLNPRIVSLTPVAGSSNRSFDLMARVDDSANVTVGIAADQVLSVGGLSNLQPAGGADRSITFTNPIHAKPGSFTLVTGAPEGKHYGFSLAAGAPKPVEDLHFAAMPDEAAADHHVELSAVKATIPAGSTKSESIRVIAAAGAVPANTPVLVSHTVSSTDSNYDGLVVNGLTVKLFSTDPSVRVTKRAFTEVGDSSTPEQIMATGTEALAGARLNEGQAVCFVFEVSNISADDWATKLTDIAVTDTDTRLGEGGLIGTISSLAIGQSARLSACASLIPIDTTVENVR